jgi:hypothetical protein
VIAHQFDGGYFRIITTLKDQGKAHIAPFDGIEIDLAYMLGID